MTVSSPQSSDLPLATRLQDLWLILLEEGADWSPERTQEYIEAARHLYELLGPRAWEGA